MPHLYPVQIYYEDTDFSGVVYHANYLKFFERAREHMIGIAELKRLYQEGFSFVVYRMEIDLRGSASHGDLLEVRSTVNLQGRLRLRFHQSLYHPQQPKSLVEAIISLACLNPKNKPVPLPPQVIEGIAAFSH
jgi:tol-pal system-associated acyl-CoA thioesterase